MTNKLSFSTIFIFILILFLSCNDDDNIQDTIAPEVQNFKTDISTAPDLDILFEGTIKDEIGLKSINIRYINWLLDKVIELDEQPKEFNLTYKFNVPKTETVGSTHTIEIIIEDIGGNIINKEVNVTLDLDVTKPEMEFERPLAGSSHLTGEMLPMKINITDDFGIESLQLVNSDMGINEDILIVNGLKNFVFEKEYLIPNGLDGSYTLEATVKDSQGNEATKSVNIFIGANITYTNLYIVGGSTWYGWDPTKATKMWQDPNDDQWFITEFFYKHNENIKFIGQLDWAPYNWGLDPNDNSKIINAQNSEAIGFPDGDSYYRVRFNPYTLQYNYEKMTNNTSVEDDMYLMGKGFVGYNLDWNPADAIPMIKDSSNPFVFSVEVEFSDAVDLKFIGQNDGWGPYDAGFITGGQTQLPVNYFKGVVGGGTADLKFTGQPGTYIITYDYFLLRTTIQPK